MRRLSRRIGPLPTTEVIWQRVQEVIDRTADFDRLTFHGLNALAVHSRRSRGRPVTDAQLDHARFMLAQTMAAEAGYDQIAQVNTDMGASPVLVFKGLELATRYPYRAARPFGDLDLISAQPDALQDALQDHGWRQGRDHESYANRHHHLASMSHPGFRLTLEIHRHPSWEIWMAPPTTPNLIERAVPLADNPSRLGLHPTDNLPAVLVHAWRGNRFGRLRDLLDVALVANDCNPGELEAAVDRYRIARLWRAALKIIDWQFGSGRPPPRPIRALVPNFADLDTVAPDPMRRMAGLPWVAPLTAAPRIMVREARARRMIHFREDRPSGGLHG